MEQVLVIQIPKMKKAARTIIWKLSERFLDWVVFIALDFRCAIMETFLKVWGIEKWEDPLFGIFEDIPNNQFLIPRRLAENQI